jgi:UDP-N-acetylglucosamine 2-epimerase (non-hydrolysing)
VEAGLRTGNLDSPYPEELNRRIIDIMAVLYFAPTVTAKEALLKEGINAMNI